MISKVFLPAIILVLILFIAGCTATTAKVEQPQGSPPVNNPVATAPGSPLPQDNPIKQQDVPPTATSTVPAEVPGPVKITVAELNKNSASLIGKEVILEGKIVQECGAGCWFNLQDPTGIVYVDLAPNNLVIPQKVGSKARVYGKVDKRSGVTYVIGSKVEF